MRFKHLHTSFISLNYQIVVNKQNLEYLNCVFFYKTSDKTIQLVKNKNYYSLKIIT